jgi:hypothetical protein
MESFCLLWNKTFYDAAVLVKKLKFQLIATLAYSLILQHEITRGNKEIRARSSPMI